jgi:hypothetical protein
VNSLSVKKMFSIGKGLTLVCAMAVLGMVSGASIYGDFAPDEPMTKPDQQAVVGLLTGLLFILMALEVTAPEVLFLIALIIVILCEILTLTEGLAGKPTLLIAIIYLNYILIEHIFVDRFLQQCLDHHWHLVLGGWSSGALSCGRLARPQDLWSDWFCLNGKNSYVLHLLFAVHLLQ